MIVVVIIVTVSQPVFLLRARSRRKQRVRVHLALNHVRLELLSRQFPRVVLGRGLEHQPEQSIRSQAFGGVFLQ